MMAGEIGTAVEAEPEVLEALWGFLDGDDVGSAELTEYARAVHGLVPPKEPSDATWSMGVALTEDGPDRGELRWIGRVPQTARHDR